MSEFKGALKGHGLKFEGRVMTYFGMGSGVGRGKCSCGAESETLPTTAARQRWHREHKMAVVREAHPRNAYWVDGEQRVLGP